MWPVRVGAANPGSFGSRAQPPASKKNTTTGRTWRRRRRPRATPTTPTGGAQPPTGTTPRSTCTRIRPPVLRLRRTHRRTRRRRIRIRPGRIRWFRGAAAAAPIIVELEGTPTTAVAAAAVEEKGSRRSRTLILMRTVTIGIMRRTLECCRTKCLRRTRHRPWIVGRTTSRTIRLRRRRDTILAACLRPT
jgi:hypothetical protein